ncbi:MAG: GvpL/GvpF family gas vesicle protein, partial [Chloroflexota bacterium]
NVFTETVPAGAENGLLARLSALVSRQRESALTVAADGYQSSWSERGYDLRVTGPWLPYRFGNAGAELLSARR